MCLLVTIAVIGLGALVAISYGIAYGIEVGLTGEGFGAEGHHNLFRICESDSTTARISAVHTCNVYRPDSDVNAQPIHAFTEYIQNWYSASLRTAATGGAFVTDRLNLNQLLASQRLSCATTNSAVRLRHQAAQIIIGGVGQPYGRRRDATACNYRSDGSNIQDHCGLYTGGGELGPVAHPHPLSINQIFEKHFGRGNCSWLPIDSTA